MRPQPTHEVPRHVPPSRAIEPARHATESAFSLLEMIIAMVLLGVALAVVGNVVVQATGGSNGARAGAISDAAIARAATMLADDVAIANTSDRRDNLLRDPADLAGALQRNDVAYSSDPSRPMMRLDIDEVVTATSTELQVRSDVHRRAGVECITWRAITGATFQLRRMVGSACGGSELSDRVVLESKNPTAANIDTSPFTYRLLCSARSCPGSRASNAAPCRPWDATTVSTAQRRWVIGVVAVLGVVTEERAAAGGHGTMRISIRSRDTETYRRGLGC